MNLYSLRSPRRTAETLAVAVAPAKATYHTHACRSRSDSCGGADGEAVARECALPSLTHPASEKHAATNVARQETAVVRVNRILRGRLDGESVGRARFHAARLSEARPAASILRKESDGPDTPRCLSTHFAPFEERSSSKESP